MNKHSICYYTYKFVTGEHIIQIRSVIYHKMLLTKLITFETVMLKK